MTDKASKTSILEAAKERQTWTRNPRNRQKRWKPSDHQGLTYEPTWNRKIYQGELVEKRLTYEKERKHREWKPKGHPAHRETGEKTISGEWEPKRTGGINRHLGGQGDHRTSAPREKKHPGERDKYSRARNTILEPRKHKK